MSEVWEKNIIHNFFNNIPPPQKKMEINGEVEVIG